HAFANETSTNYFSVFAAEHLKMALAAQAALLQNGDLKINDVGTRLNSGANRLPDRRVAADRFTSDGDDPGRFSSGRVMSMAFGSRPPDATRVAESGLPIQERVSGFFRGGYRPDKLVICLVGDVMTFDALVEIQQLYGDFGADVSPQTRPIKPEPVK